MTPEGKIKAAINKVLASYPDSYSFMPVPYGYGTSTVDYLICHYGLFIGIEAKAPGQHPTARQRQIIYQIRTAGGEAFVIDSIDKCHHLRIFLEQVKQNATSLSQPQASDGGGTISREHPEYFPVREEHIAQRRAAPAAAAPPDRDLSPAEDGVRRTEPDPDALRLVRGDAVQESEVNVGNADAGAARIRPERDGDGKD